MRQESEAHRSKESRRSRASTPKELDGLLSASLPQGTRQERRTEQRRLPAQHSEECPRQSKVAPREQQAQHQLDRRSRNRSDHERDRSSPGLKRPKNATHDDGHQEAGGKQGQRSDGEVEQ